MTRTLAALVFLLLVPLAACGGQSHAAAKGDAGVTAVVGTINGVSLPAAYALAVPDNANTTAPPTNQYAQLTLAIASKPLGCTTAGLPNGAFLGVSITLPGPNPIGPGTYTINNDPTNPIDNTAALVTTDLTCAETAAANCVGGTVTITDLTDTTMSGSFTLAFDSGEAIHGTFTAELCTKLPAALNGSAC